MNLNKISINHIFVVPSSKEPLNIFCAANFLFFFSGQKLTTISKNPPIKMFCRVFVSIALICAIPSTYSYSAGGDALSPACDDMTPQHHVEPSLSPVPYKLNLSTNKLRAGKDEPVTLKIQGKSAGDTIKGFMIQARIGKKPVGKFIVKSKKHAQLLSCSGGSDVSKFIINRIISVNKRNQGQTCDD